MSTLPNITPHPVLQNLQIAASALVLVPAVASASVTATSDITFGSSTDTYAYHPRKIRATAAGSFVFQLVSDSADVTVTLAAGEEFVGWIKKIDATTMDDPIIVFW